MSTDAVTRDYREGDEAAIVSLLNTAFNGWPKQDIGKTSIDYFKWKYKNRLNDKKIFKIIEIDGEIVASIHAVLLNIKLHDKKYVTCLGADVAVDPRHRRSGFFQIVMNSLKEEMEKQKFGYFFVITGNTWVLKVFSRMDDYMTMPISRINQVMIRDIDLHLEKMPEENQTIKKIGFRALKAANQILKKENVSNTNITIEQVNEFPLDIEEFNEKVANLHDYMIWRDKSYLDWRYCDPCSMNYNVLTARKEGDLQGYIVFVVNRYNPKYPVGYITDLVYLPEEPDMGMLLVQRAMKILDEKDVNIVNHLTVRGHRNEQTMYRRGFLDSRREVGLYYNTLGNTEIEEMFKKLEPSKTLISWGDLDTLPAGKK